jgi:sulfur-carrier protein
MPIVTLRYWAAAKEAAGVTEQQVEAVTLADALAAALATATASPATGQAGRLRRVLARSSFLIDSQPAGTRPPDTVALSDGSVIEVLPPFAGG